MVDLNNPFRADALSALVVGALVRRKRFECSVRIVDVMWSSYLLGMPPSFFRLVLGAPAHDDTPTPTKTITTTTVVMMAPTTR